MSLILIKAFNTWCCVEIDYFFLVRQNTVYSFGDRTFAAAATRVWNMEQFAAWHEKTGTVIRPVQAVSEDIFIRTVRPRRIVNCLTAPPRNILTYLCLLTY